MGIDFAQNAFGQSGYRVACQETYDNYRHIKQHSVQNIDFKNRSHPFVKRNVEAVGYQIDEQHRSQQLIHFQRVVRLKALHEVEQGHRH